MTVGIMTSLAVTGMEFLVGAFQIEAFSLFSTVAILWVRLLCVYSVKYIHMQFRTSRSKQIKSCVHGNLFMNPVHAYLIFA